MVGRSVFSILLQLQAFITDEKLHYAAEAEGIGTMMQAKQAMREFKCIAAGCSHDGEAPWPPSILSTAEARPTEKRIVCRPCGAINITSTPPRASSLVDDADALPSRFPQRPLSIARQDSEESLASFDSASGGSLHSQRATLQAATRTADDPESSTSASNVT